MKRLYDKRLLCLILCLGLIFQQGFYGNATHVVAAQTGTVKASSLNVRSEPSNTSSKVKLGETNVFLLKGETVNILEEENGWYYISMKFNGKTVKGYVSSDFIQTKEETEPTPTATPKPTAKPTPTPTPTPYPVDLEPDKVTKDFEIKAFVNASSLNVRKGPGTNYTKVAGLTVNNSVTILNEVMIDSVKWYRISFLSAKKVNYGYVSSEYIKIAFKDTVKGNIAVTKISIRTAAGSKKAYLKNEKGNTISLKKSKAVTILKEVTVENVKWYRVSFMLSDIKYSGYILANQVLFRVTTKVPTPTPVTVKPSTTPKLTPALTPKVTTAPTPKVTATPTPKVSPTSIPQEIISTSGFLEVPNIKIYKTIDTSMVGYVCNTFYLNVYENIERSISYLYEDIIEPVLLMNGQKVTVTKAVAIDNKIWYQILFTSSKGELRGSVPAEYIYISDVPPVIDTVPVPTPKPGPVKGDIGTDEANFEVKLAVEGFPDSYKDSLRFLHQLYPSWEFKAFQTGINWNTVITEESIPGKNLLPNNKSVEWKSFEPGAYKWETDTFTVFDGSTWVTASKRAIEYYMDPRNFLTDRGIFQFELLTYQRDYQNTKGVENILSNTALSNATYTFVDSSGKTQNYTYADTFVKAGEYSGVSPYHLASRVKQEVVTGATTLSSSVSGKVYGYEGLYNFYNIGANDSTLAGGAVANGLRYAFKGSSNATTNSLYLIPWTNQYNSIVGGAYFIGSTYIKRGQDTVYLQKFNVTSTSRYFHQYMTNVEAPFAEGKKIYTAYSSMPEMPIVFSIPVYNNMPSNPAPIPTTQFNPNNRLKSLKVYNQNGEECSITPTFDQTVKNYDLFVANNIEMVNIIATTVSKKAKIIGGGNVLLGVGINRIVVPVIAENGDLAEYIINIVRE